MKGNFRLVKKFVSFLHKRNPMKEIFHASHFSSPSLKILFLSSLLSAAFKKKYKQNTAVVKMEWKSFATISLKHS